MGKYAPIRGFLESSGVELIPMTFARVEDLLGFKLPNSSGYPAWWSNNPTNNVMTHEWLAAGYKTEQVDIEGRKLVFRRTAPPIRGVGSAESVKAKQSRRHSLFGWMKGTVTVAPGVDLTQPADPEWGEAAWGTGRGERKA